MADVFVDKILENEELEKEWFSKTKDFIKLKGFNKMLKKFLEASNEVNDAYWNKNNYPNHIFKGDASIKITDIADEYGLKPLGKKLRICPFHKDKDPSLSLSDEKSIFNCFGCGVKGNIITFTAMLKRGKKNVNK